jgi:hypothetical protein
VFDNILQQRITVGDSQGVVHCYISSSRSPPQDTLREGFTVRYPRTGDPCWRSQREVRCYISSAIVHCKTFSERNSLLDILGNRITATNLLTGDRCKRFSGKSFALRYPRTGDHCYRSSGRGSPSGILRQQITVRDSQREAHC